MSGQDKAASPVLCECCVGQKGVEWCTDADDPDVVVALCADCRAMLTRQNALTSERDADPFTDGEREFLLDADIAAEQVAAIISDFTHDEVDGDGSPWEIALDHLTGLLSIFAAVCERFPEVASWLADEYAIVRYGTGLDNTDSPAARDYRAGA